jgi:DNA-binding response OmpR family regulator
VSRTICVIEDDELVRAHLAQTLQAAGHTVFEAGSAEAGIELIRTQKADVAVVDILMPDRDGLEAIGQLRRTRPDLRIVAISGGGRVGPQVYLGLAQQIGADASLVKPIEGSALLAAVEPG